jgi:2-haloacid dehalogenase
MFDFYGTIVDMQSGLTEAIGPFLRSRSYDGQPSSVVTWWRRAHFENSMIDALLHREHTPYREISRRALAYTLERARIVHTMEEVDRLVAAIERLRPFPDVLAALRRLQQRFALVILSNGDPDMLERGVAHAGFPFDRVISVAEAGCFKPHVATYRKAAELLAVAPSAILFVANHPFDCVGAKAFGMRTAYVNRRRRPFGGWPYQPDLVATSFHDLAARLLG